MQSSVFTEMAARWPSSVVARAEINRFTGGTLSPHYLANLDSRGLGPPNRYRCGRKVFYPVADLVKWLAERTHKIPPRG